MDAQKVRAVLDLSRNGCNSYFRHPLARSFLYTDGVKELAELGAYWLLDILGTEGVQAIRKDQDASNGSMVVCKLAVAAGGDGFTITLSSNDDNPPFYTFRGPFTTFPEFGCTLYLQDDGEHVVCILPSEY